MVIAEQISQTVQALPPASQQSVLDFVEFLAQRERAEDEAWSRFSLDMALRGMEDDKGPEYTDADLKER